jgi:predicted MFS family arabinose efflux permease
VAIDRHVSVRTAAVVGLASLAAAMGIGRFAFTPIFPLMQETLGVTLDEGVWLATANYGGYLLGACISFALTPKAGVSAKWGLLAVAVATLAMGSSNSLLIWLFLRCIAGVASAFVLVGASAWSLAHLASYRRSDLSGFVFAGVGIGIALAGALALFSAALGGNPAGAWVALGVVALAVALCTWRGFAVLKPAARGDAPAATRVDRSSWLLVVCYGVFGLGYIVPATFIPAIARTLVSDPLVFGWAWPVFGLAAAVSTVTTLFRSTAPRRVAAVSLLVMAVGVAAPAIDKSLGALLVSALCVGGTFMVMTMAGVQEARRVSTGDPTKLISALTAAFALGQLAGPVFVSISHSATNGLILVSSLAAALLVGSALALLCVHDGALPRTDPLPHERTR